MSTKGLTSWEKAEFASYQSGEVDELWYTERIYNRSFELGTIECEVFEEAFLWSIFPLREREVMVEDFINLRQGYMIFEEYSLNFNMFSMYAPSFVSNLKDKMSRFVNGVTDLVYEECHKAMIHNDMNFFRLMVYA